MTRTHFVPVCGALLLALPVTFIVSCLLNHPLYPTVLGNPVLLVGCLLIPIAFNLWIIAKVRILPGNPAVLDTSLELRTPCLLVTAAGSIMILVLVGYLFVENIR